ncbi:hypothetical protein ANN_08172 [Periplaneta americana]|uniref:Uncharacterized protein n=1 Tax=Periplaneta americana TaxID=6978 RepID=A0ABQ8T232_PERAM|nr:hypothetical protein ANN_08172 [Periplaneta americana]
MLNATRYVRFELPCRHLNGIQPPANCSVAAAFVMCCLSFSKVLALPLWYTPSFTKPRKKVLSPQLHTCVEAARRWFHHHFQLRLHDPVASSHVIMAWVPNLEKIGSALKEKPPGKEKTVRTPEILRLLELL